MANTCYSIVLWGYFNVGQIRTTEYSPNKSHCATEHEYLPGQCWRVMAWSSTNHGIDSQKSVKNLHMGENSNFCYPDAQHLAHTHKYIISNSYVL